MKMIWLDMDGTIADLYSVDSWLNMIRSEDARPYAMARPLVNMAVLAVLLNQKKKQGYGVGIVSAMPKDSNPLFDARIIKAKLDWLGRYLPTVKWDAIEFTAYADIKNMVNQGEDILFDDEIRHLNAWTGTAYNACDLLNVLALP